MYYSLPGSSVHGLLPPGESTPIAQGPVGLPPKVLGSLGSPTVDLHAVWAVPRLWRQRPALKGVIDRGHVGGREGDKESGVSSFGARWRAAAGRRGGEEASVGRSEDRPGGGRPQFVDLCSGLLAALLPPHHTEKGPASSLPSEFLPSESHRCDQTAHPGRPER